MTSQGLPAQFMDLLNSVTEKRARTVIDHILAHGHITTEELKERYGYNHPPRAARDVREHGIPLETFRTTAADGRSIGAYRFGDPEQARSAQLAGRTALSARLKRTLIEQHGARCHIYRAPCPEQDLQIDHRIPFEIAGEPNRTDEETDAYMLLCASANRAKSWSCEHCPNWQDKIEDTCRTCYWAYPDDYTHIATREERRLDILWAEDEVGYYDKLREKAGGKDELPDFVKEVLRRHLASTGD